MVAGLQVPVQDAEHQARPTRLELPVQVQLAWSWPTFDHGFHGTSETLWDVPKGTEGSCRQAGRTATVSSHKHQSN